MLLDLVLIILCGALIVLLALIILSRNPRQKVNQLFAFLAFATTSWTVFNYLSGIRPTSLLLTRLVFLGGILTACGLLSFVSYFPKENKIVRSLPMRAYMIFTVLLIPVVFTNYFISSVTETTIETEGLYLSFILYASLALILLVYVMASQIKHAADARQRQQVILVSSGVFIYAFFAVISNVLVPLFVNDWSSSRFGPVFSLALVGMVAYAIVKHRLFDIRLVVARSVGYILTLSAIGVMYGAVVFGAASYFLGSNNVDNMHRVVYVGAAVFLSLTLQPLRNFFDRISDRIFYRDNYDPQIFMDQLNGVLVTTIDLNVLLNKVARVISGNLKAEYCVFVVTNETKRREIGTKFLDISTSDYALIKNRFTSRTTVLSIDDIAANEHDLKQAFDDKNISVAVGVVDSKQKSMNNMILVGPKKSGNPYNDQDKRIMVLCANELSIAIQNAISFEEIQQFNSTLQQKVADATKELRKTNEKLKALDEAKDEFISMASHQLRTPLTSVKGYVSMVLDGDAGKITADQRDLLEQAYGSSQRMVYLIADLLNVSRLRTGKFVIQAAPTQLADVVEAEVSQLKETAKMHDLELTYEKPSDFPMLNIDEMKTRQVIMNFMDNAIYYTPSGGHIRVELRASDKAIEYKVIDDGLGVPKSEQHHLFTKFYRAGNAKKARPDGTGLGLFMAKKVVVAQGGSIIFESEEGKGSTFGFSLPRSTVEVKN